jgi:hypothetical protein
MTTPELPKNHIPKVSVISIALKAEEFEPLVNNLTHQTFQDYEFVGEAGGSIPEAWNRAIRRARGDILVFTETDAKPVNERWLEEMVTGLVDEKTILKGLEITSSSFDLTNLAAHRSAFENVRFDKRFKWSAETDLLSRLKAQGYRLVQLRKAPVMHFQKSYSKHYMRRSFYYGLYWARLRRRYSDPVDPANVALAGKILAAALLNLLGLVIGYFVYLPERFYRKRK